MEIWLAWDVFIADFRCRTLYQSEAECEASLAHAQCQCEDWILSGTNGTQTSMRVFDDGTLAMASLAFIWFLLVEFWRLYWSVFFLWYPHCRQQDWPGCGLLTGPTTAEVYSLLGFFAVFFAPDDARTIEPSRARIVVFLMHLFFVFLQIQVHAVMARVWHVDAWSALQIATLVLLACDMCEIIISHASCAKQPPGYQVARQAPPPFESAP